MYGAARLITFQAITLYRLCRVSINQQFHLYEHNNNTTREICVHKYRRSLFHLRMSSDESAEIDHDTSSDDEEASKHSANSDDEARSAIREDLKTMSFEEIMQLKEQLGAKVYKEAVLGNKSAKERKTKTKLELKRLNKNRPREISAKRQVPFLGAELRKERKKQAELRDPRFDEKSGTYNIDTFKRNYQFVTKIRNKEVNQLKKSLDNVHDEEERKKIKHTMQRLVNKNVEDKRWRIKQKMLTEERREIQKAHEEGRQPHYVTKKERRAKELVAQFEHLKDTGKLNKHLEKRRKKNAAKDRKRISIE